MASMNNLYGNKQASVMHRYIGPQPGWKSSSRPVDKPLANRGFCSFIGLHRISFVRASEQSFRTYLIFSQLEIVRNVHVL